jgi:hypothetical protein
MGWVEVYDKYKTCGLGLSRPEKINSCDPVTRIRHECGFLILLTRYQNSLKQKDLPWLK